MTPELEALERLKPCPFCHNPKLDHMFVELKNDGYEFYCLKVWCHIDEKDGQAVGCDAYFEFTNPTKAGTVLSFNDRTDKPRPWLRAEEVTEPGWYWHAPGDLTMHARRAIEPNGGKGLIVLIGHFYAPIGKCRHAEGCTCALGGLWQRIPEPELPNNQPGGDDGK